MTQVVFLVYELANDLQCFHIGVYSTLDYAKQAAYEAYKAEGGKAKKFTWKSYKSHSITTTKLRKHYVVEQYILNGDL